MKDLDVKQIVLKQIMSAMNNDATEQFSLRVKKKDKEEEKKPVRRSALSDIRSMLA